MTETAALTFDLAPDGLPQVAALLERQMRRPAWQAALARENAAE
jgi:hypothetical protein